MFIGEVRAHIGKGGLGDFVIAMVNQTHYLDHVEVVEAHWESQAAEEAGRGGGQEDRIGVSNTRSNPLSQLTQH